MLRPNILSMDFRVMHPGTLFHRNIRSLGCARNEEMVMLLSMGPISV
jgi:hypothetical protein